jgi:hypothetical protein
MDPFLLAAMTLVTLTAGGVFTWLVVRRASADLAQELHPELGQIHADLARLRREQTAALERLAGWQAQFNRNLSGLQEERTASGEQLQKMQVVLAALSDQASAAASPDGASLAALRELEGRLPKGLEAKLEALSLEPLADELRRLGANSEERWATESARWVNQGGQLDNFESRLSALGGRLGQVLEGVERLEQAQQAVLTQVNQLATSPSATCLPDDRSEPAAPERGAAEEATGGQQSEALYALEQTSRQLRESVIELEVALEAAIEQTAIARAENEVLRTAGQADVERLWRRYSAQIQAIAKGLEGLDQTLDRTLAPARQTAARRT